ncbi:MAG TPA: DnaD domain protein [Epulopiscium sp.]|nr:DnaD domain protein [Candidatus Epulonipiscium sp.]
MATLKLTTDNHSSSIAVPSWFVHDYMPLAMGGYVKVYLYLLTAYYERTELLTIEDTAALLSMLSSEVIAALEYWQSKNILTFSALSKEDFEVSFTLTAPSKSGDLEAASLKATDTDLVAAHIKKVEQAKNETPVKTNTYIQQTRPNYSPSELSIYLQDSQVQELYKMAEKSLGRLLSSSDQQILFGLYDWLHMPLNLIEYLLDYCATKGHTSMRYIEKTAIGWLNDGVNTLEQAMMRSNTDKLYFKILSEVGLGTQNITQVQKEFIGKWLNTYKLSIEVILEGCRRTSAQTKNPSLNYLDTIFTSWHKNNVISLEDITKLDNAFTSKQAQTPKYNSNNKSPIKKTAFNSLQGRDWDFTELEKLENDRMKRLLNER